MYEFNAYGHENITSKHKTTLEFTKDSSLTLNGDCIVGVKADFSLPLLKKFIRSLKNKNIKILIKVNNLKEEINAEINPDFNDDKEIVIRKSNFIDKRTFAINADKSAFDLNKELIDHLKDNKIKISILN